MEHANVQSLNKQELTYGHIWKVSYPIILGGVAQTIINITDSAFLGRISEAALGASAIAGLFYVSVMMLLYGFSVGTQIIIARLDGEKNYTEIGKVTNHALLTMTLFSVFLYLFLSLATPGILKAFVHSKEVADLSEAFIRYRAFGILFTAGLFAMRAFFTGIAETKMVVYTTGIIAVLNVLFNYIFVFGHAGMPRMEAAGSGLASSLSECVALVFNFVYVCFMVDRNKYPLFRRSRFESSRIKEMLAISSPVMFQFFISVGSWFIFFLIVEQMGERELAISNIIRNSYLILMVPLMGFSSATNTLVSNLIGQKRPEDIFKMIKRIALLSFITTLILLLVILLKPYYMFRIFTSQADLIAETYPPFYVICGSLMLFSVANIFLCSVSGIGKTGISLVIEITTIVFYLIACYFAGVRGKLSISWVWSVEYVYFLLISIFSLIYLKHARQRNYHIKN